MSAERWIRCRRRRRPAPRAPRGLLRHGWGEREIPEEQLYDLVLDPNEADNLAADPAHRATRDDLRARLEAWMRETDDPLLAGHVEPPPGVEINLPDQRSALEPTSLVG